MKVEQMDGTFLKKFQITHHRKNKCFQQLEIKQVFTLKIQ